MCGAGAYLVHSAGGRCFHAVIWFCEVFSFDVNPIHAKLDSPPLRPHAGALSLHGVVMDPAPSWTRSRFRCWSSLRTYIFPADVTLAADCLLVGLPACPVRCGAVWCHPCQASSRCSRPAWHPFDGWLRWVDGGSAPAGSEPAAAATAKRMRGNEGHTFHMRWACASGQSRDPTASMSCPAAGVTGRLHAHTYQLRTS